MVYAMGDDSEFLSSSPNVGYDDARHFFLSPDVADANLSIFRAAAFSVRCFKDSYLEFPSSEGGDSSIGALVISIET